MSTVELAAVLRGARSRAGLSMREAAERAGVSVGWWHAVEHGRLVDPGGAAVCRAADAVGVSRTAALRAVGWLR